MTLTKLCSRDFISCWESGIYNLSCKTVNTRENFRNAYCFVTNQMQEETAKINGQTAAGISHDLMWNNDQALSSTRNLQFSPCISLEKLSFLLPTNTSHLILSVQKPNYWIDLKVSANCEYLQCYRFTSWVKVSQLQKIWVEKHQAQPTSTTFWTASCL